MVKRLKDCLIVHGLSIFTKTLKVNGFGKGSTLWIGKPADWIFGKKLHFSLDKKAPLWSRQGKPTFSVKSYRFQLIVLLFYGTMRLVYFEHKKYNRGQYKIRRPVMDGYMTLREVSEKWGITARMVNYYCSSGRIKGAVKVSTLWLIPQEAEKPADKRMKVNKTMEVEP